MLKRSLIAFGLVALIAYVVGIWIWQSYGFPIEHEICNQTADNAHTNCATYNVGLIALWKIGEALSNLAFATLLTTIAVAFFTGRLWFSTEKLWGVTNQSVGLARNEFLSSHRPRMRIKHIWLVHNTDWRLRGPLEVNLDIVNIGNNPGYITWINFESVLLPRGQRLPQRPPYDEMPPLPPGIPPGADIRTSRFLNNQVIPPGLTYPRTVCDGRILDTSEVMGVLHGEWQLYLIGTIEYFDAIPTGAGIGLGGLRQTGFCRRLTFTNYPPPVGDHGRFEIEKDPDYEFEEWGN